MIFINSSETQNCRFSKRGPGTTTSGINLFHDNLKIIENEDHVKAMYELHSICIYSSFIKGGVPALAGTEDFGSSKQIPRPTGTPFSKGRINAGIPRQEYA